MPRRWGNGEMLSCEESSECPSEEGFKSWFVHSRGPREALPRGPAGLRVVASSSPARGRLEEAQGGSHSPCLDCVEGESLALGLAHLGSNPSSATLRLSDRCLGT